MIRLENVSKYYTTSSTFGVGIRNVSLSLHLGEFVAITGESGSGKSTLLNVISGLDTYEEGELFLFGEETSHYTINDWEKYRSANVGFIFQNYNIIESYTVLQNILLALELQGYADSNRKQRALELIDKVGLSHRVHHKASKLSGGEKQRAVIARALAKDCPIIVADEPTGHLDSVTSKSIINLLNEISKEKLVVVVTHNFEELEPYVTRRIRVKDGEVIEDRYLRPYQTLDAQKTTDEFKKHNLFKITRFALRNIFSMPKRLVFLLSLQVLIIGIFIFIYAFIASSADILLADDITSTDSSYQLAITRRDNQPIDVNDFTDMPNIRSIAEYETAYKAYNAFSVIVDSVGIGVFPSGPVNMDSAIVLNTEDLTIGVLPSQKNEVVVSDVMAAQHKLTAGSSITLLGRHTNSRTIGTVYTVVGTTILGSTSTIFFHNDIFSDKVVALEGLLNEATRVIGFTYMVGTEDAFGNVIDEIEESSVMSFSQIIFSDEIEEDGISFYEGLIVGYAPNSYTLRVGPVYSNIFLDSIPLNKVSITEYPVTSTILMSTSYRERLVNYFFGDDYQAYRLILNVEDIRSGRALARQIDQSVYRVYYPANVNTSDRVISSNEYNLLSYVVIACIGVLLYTILGVVVKNINYARKKDFSIYRSIGADRATLAKQVIIEQILLGTVAFIITVAFLELTALLSYRVRQSMRYVEIYQYVVLFVISILLAIQIAQRFNRRIFKFSVITSLNNEMEEKL